MPAWVSLWMAARGSDKGHGLVGRSISRWRGSMESGQPIKETMRNWLMRFNLYGPQQAPPKSY